MMNESRFLLKISRLGLRCSMAALPIALFMACTTPVKAATLCVDQTGTLDGCLTTISAAIAIAGPGDVIGVSPGTYHEQIVVTMPLTLIGNNPTTTFIDASGFSNGIFVDGLHNPGLSQVFIRGFNIENANFEGILALNVNDLSIEKNTIHNNDKNINAPSGLCPGLPAFETGENADCGEAIHLMGVTNSVVSENTLNSNAGGILLSDETGANHNNLVAQNVIIGNPYSNGITLASYAASVPITPPQVTFGVYSNSILDNVSNSNGIGGEVGGGGVAIFAPGAGHSAYSNSITGNTLTSNGLAGVLIHALGTGSGGVSAPNAGNNSIVGNLITGNGPDPAAGATTPTGVAIYGDSPVPDLMIYGNTFASETVDVFFNSPSTLSIHNNDLVGTTGLVNQNPAGIVNARENYWGCAFVTPGTGGCSGIVGSNIMYSPWLVVSINPPVQTPPVTPVTPPTTTPTPPTTGSGGGDDHHCDSDWDHSHDKDHDKDCDKDKDKSKDKDKDKDCDKDHDNKQGQNNQGQNNNNQGHNR